ncbi:hypothetical protein [Leptolyngbya iicbica]|uniref:Uncharacterized protein n=2 Tax=Cyanophyceae TaxID=3028117 RepID=A0A4Q7E6I5_9CYAN|nr:hypothetical protein [Leptolyngbya sp. LK]RZM78740.1 hypothetical protein DYY88_08040 [Leptolyngbya sp. LK]
MALVAIAAATNQAANPGVKQAGGECDRSGSGFEQLPTGNLKRQAEYCFSVPLHSSPSAPLLVYGSQVIRE